LSREDGKYINAPYTSAGGTDSFPPDSAVIPEPVAVVSDQRGGLLSVPVAAFLLVVVIGLVAALLLIAVRHRNSVMAKQHAVSKRLWDKQSGDDFSFDARLRGGIVSRAIHAVTSNLSWRIRADKDPNSGATSVVRNATWMSNVDGRDGGYGDDDGSSVCSNNSGAYSTGSGSSRQQDNDSFLASLRQEANITMNRMIKDPKTSTTDPRLDGGASIKSLLTHYREGKKEVLLVPHEDHSINAGEEIDRRKEGDGARVIKERPEKQRRAGGSFGKQQKTRRPPPPPPPPRRKNKDLEAHKHDVNSTDRFSDFSII